VLNPNRGASLKVKVLSKGSLSKKLTFEGLLVSETAKKAIESAGGEIRQPADR